MCEGFAKAPDEGRSSRVAGPETLGLTLDEAKTILRGVQQAVVTTQAAAHVAARRHCGDCGATLRLKGHHQTQFRTLFGTVTLASPLWGCKTWPGGLGRCAA